VLPWKEELVMSRIWKVLLTIAIAIGGITFLAVQSMGEVEYYVHVDELVANQQKWKEARSIQVHGYAENVPLKGTMVGELIRREFEIEWKGVRLAVRHDGVVPDTFKEQAETVVKGRLTEENGRLVLVTVGGEAGIMAKCPSKYDGAKK
jgi:cytochrome c-type biogenesis protein CcmE